MQFLRKTEREFPAGSGKMQPSSWFKLDGRTFCISGDYSSPEKQAELAKLVSNGQLEPISTVQAGKRVNSAGEEFFSPAFTIVGIKASAGEKALSQALYQAGVDNRINSILTQEELNISTEEYRAKSRELAVKAEEDMFNAKLAEVREARKAARAAAEKLAAEEKAKGLVESKPEGQRQPAPTGK